MLTRVLSWCLFGLGSTGALAAMKSEAVAYRLGYTDMAGVLVFDDATDTKRPGLLMVPNWYGVNDGQVEKAKAIAGSKYVIFIADVYGTSVRPTNNEEAGKAAGGMYQDRSVLRQRARAALDAFKGKATDAPIDLNRLGAIGFCFGGATVLELARDGIELAGIASFHGNLGADPKWPVTSIKTPILAMNGADDTYVPAEQISAFTNEMQGAGADFQFVNFGGAVHCFAEPDANSPGCLYNERAAKRGFQMMNNFFDDAFAKH
ncbi:dienelactone hydrolase [Ahniella affigens]|uniref:Dienelactone hydrolase n=1 Tax=Ahniella affigens TaxID=2021234 RepID=A0A2P1PY27_9GAMM|nr:dienelactone hydrolase family protein [Ahniella affigens]AVP99714.1 dienelactone hydrolase [Ahniella affigens]